MAIIRAYTTIEQSRKLAEILPLESADMYWFRDDTEIPKIYPKDMMKNSVSVTCPCWSLASLLCVLPKGIRLLKSANISSVADIKYYCDCPKGTVHEWYDNPVDACVAMIEKLHELNLL